MPYVNHSLTISQSVILTISNWYSFIFAINSIHQQQFLTISGWYSQWAYQTLRNWYETRLINIITLEWWLGLNPPWYRKPPYSPYYPTILTHIILLLLVIPILSMDVVVVASLIFTINHQKPNISHNSSLQQLIQRPADCHRCLCSTCSPSHQAKPAFVNISMGQQSTIYCWLGNMCHIWYK